MSAQAFSLNFEVPGLFRRSHDRRRKTISHGLTRRDPELLDRLIEQYQNRLYRYLLFLTSNTALAEDLFQERGFAFWNGDTSTTEVQVRIVAVCDCAESGD